MSPCPTKAEGITSWPLKISSNGLMHFSVATLMPPVRLLRSATKALRNSIANTAASSASRPCGTFGQFFPQMFRNSNWSVASESGHGHPQGTVLLASLLYTLFLMPDEGVWADVKVGNEHLRLFAEHNALGVQASVYNVISKKWIAPSEPVGDIEHGKQRAASHAQEYLRRVAGLELSSLQWKASRSA